MARTRGNRVPCFHGEPRDAALWVDPCSASALIARPRGPQLRGSIHSFCPQPLHARIAPDHALSRPESALSTVASGPTDLCPRSRVCPQSRSVHTAVLSTVLSGHSSSPPRLPRRALATLPRPDPYRSTPLPTTTSQPGRTPPYQGPSPPPSPPGRAPSQQPSHLATVLATKIHPDQIPS